MMFCFKQHQVLVQQALDEAMRLCLRAEFDISPVKSLNLQLTYCLRVASVSGLLSPIDNVQDLDCALCSPA